MKKKFFVFFCGILFLSSGLQVVGSAETIESLTTTDTSIVSETTSSQVNSTSSSLTSETSEEFSSTSSSEVQESTIKPAITETAPAEVAEITITSQKNDRRYLQPVQSKVTVYTAQATILSPTTSVLPTGQLIKTTMIAQTTEGDFVAVSNQKNQAIGWVKKADVRFLSGTYETVNRYVSLTKKGYSRWQDPSFSKELGKSYSYYQRTLRMGEVFHHTNGANYLALYLNNGTFVGYLNANGTTASSGQQGIFYKENQYATITSKNYTLWNDFGWQKKRGISSTFFGKTVKIKGRYQHYNGARYYSLYDMKGKWLGYINAAGVKATTQAQGTYQSYGKYVTITNKNYTIWGNFNWKVKRNKTANFAGQTLLAKGKYGHSNGSVYYSLYNNKGKWVGYLNAKAATVANNGGGIWQKETRKVRVAKKNYTLWQNFSWQKRSNTTSYYNQILQVKGKYRHFNGATYYSLYTTAGKWVGYGNSGAFTTPNVIYSQKTINRFVKISNGSGNFLANADPYSRLLGKKATYKGYMARAIKEAKTNNGTYLYLVLPGGNLGWIKSNQTYSVQNNFWLHTTGGRYPSLKVNNLNIQVSVSKQRVYIRSGSKTIYTMLCSTGLWNNPTPYGNFRIQQEKGSSFWFGGSGGAYYRSYHQHGVYLFHTVPIAYPGTTAAFNPIEGAKLGQRASHGCIRLSVPDAKWFYYNIPYNTPVKIYK